MDIKKLAVKLKTTHKPAKPPQTNQTTHTSSTKQTNYPKPAKPPTKHPIITRKPVFYVTKNLSNNAKHVLSFQLFYAIILTFSSKDQSHVGIVGKICEII